MNGSDNSPSEWQFSIQSLLIAIAMSALALVPLRGWRNWPHLPPLSDCLLSIFLFGSAAGFLYGFGWTRWRGGTIGAIAGGVTAVVLWLISIVVH